MDIRAAFPFPIIGIDSDNGSEFINWHLLRWCEQTRRPSPGLGRGSATTASTWSKELGGGAHRGRLPPVRHGAELLLLNKIWLMQSRMTNYFGPQQKLISKVRKRPEGDQEIRHAEDPAPAGDRARRRRSARQAILVDTNQQLNPASIQREIQDPTNQLLTVATSKKGPGRKPPTTATAMCAS